MRQRLAVVAVVALVVLAGCSGGGGSSTATEEESTPTDAPGMDMATPTEAGTGGTTPTEAGTGETTPPGTDGATDGTPDTDPGDDASADPPGVEDGELTNPSALFGDSTQEIGAVSRMEMHVRNSTGEDIDYLSLNDTEADRHLIRFDRSSFDGPVEYYLTDEYAAVRNESTGQIRYDGPNGAIAFSAAVRSFYAITPFVYAGAMNWTVSDTRTVDGTQAYDFEASGINQSALSSGDLDVQTDIQSAEGSMTVTEDGLFRDMTLNITAVNADGTTSDLDISLSMIDEPVTVDQPDWFDEGEAESSAGSGGA